MAIVKLNLSGHANADLEANGFLFPGALHVDLADPELATKVVEFLRPLMGSGDVVHVTLPGLSALSALVLVSIHGLTGTFPVLVPLVRGEAGFVPGPAVDLQALRNDVGRASREGVVVL